MDFWYQNKRPWYTFFLLPLSWLVHLISHIKRQKRRRKGYLKPILVVGNITVGGTGKTPMIQYIAELCASHSLKVGIVSRGYGGQSDVYPLLVTKKTLAQTCGDEPKLLNDSLGVPVVVSPDRHAAVNHLLKYFDVDLIISDDGLQHYNMARDIEVVMIDGERGLGNGYLLPMGPLRERTDRLKTVDFLVSKGSCKVDIAVNAEAELNLTLPKNFQHQDLPKTTGIDLITAIGHGQNFLRSIEALGYQVSNATFLADHAVIPESLLMSETPIVITEKDAVKLDLDRFPNLYVAPLRFHLPEIFDGQLLTLIRDKINEKSSHHTS